MKKEDVLAIVADKKSAAGQPFDDISAAVAAIDLVVQGDAAAIQAQLDQANADLKAKSDELDALKAKEADEAAKLAQDEVDLAALKASLLEVQAKLAKDDDALAKFKAILVELSA